jgi:hypothetical protein
MTATRQARRCPMKTLTSLAVVAGLFAGALTPAAAPARPMTAPGGLGSKIAFTRTEDALPGPEDSDSGEIWVMNPTAATGDSSPTTTPSTSARCGRRTGRRSRSTAWTRTPGRTCS